MLHYKQSSDIFTSAGSRHPTPTGRKLNIFMIWLNSIF